MAGGRGAPAILIAWGVGVVATAAPQPAPSSQTLLYIALPFKLRFLALLYIALPFKLRFFKECRRKATSAF